MITADEIKSVTAAQNSKTENIQLEYFLQWILWGIYQEEFLKNTLAFKGGTALQTVYFPPGWRTSVDLDFSVYSSENENNKVETFPPSDISKPVMEVFRQLRHSNAEELREIFTRRFENAFKKIKEESGIDLLFEDNGFNLIAGDSSLQARIKYNPIIETQQTKKIKIDISLGEVFVSPPINKKIGQTFKDLPEFEVLVYSLEEIIREKIRAIIDKGERGTPKARHYYDLWMITKNGDFNILEVFGDSKVGLYANIAKKHKEGLPHFSVPVFFKKETLREIYPHWEQDIGQLVKKKLEDFDEAKVGLKAFFDLYEAMFRCSSGFLGTRFRVDFDRLLSYTRYNPKLVKPIVEILVEHIENNPLESGEQLIILVNCLLRLARSGIETLRNEIKKFAPRLQKIRAGDSNVKDVLEQIRKECIG